MLFDQLDLWQRSDVLDRGYSATWLLQVLHQRGVCFIIRCDSTCGWAYLPTTQADKVSTWALDGAAQMHVRLVRHVSSSGRIRVLATSSVASSQQALLVDVATKVLADNLAALLNRSVVLPGSADAGGVRRKVNRAQAARALSRCIERLLLIAGAAVQIVGEWGQTLGRAPIRHVAGPSRPQKQSKHKPHPSQACKRAA